MELFLEQLRLTSLLWRLSQKLRGAQSAVIKLILEPWRLTLEPRRLPAHRVMETVV
jgi:hypothetical protein